MFAMTVHRTPEEGSPRGVKSSSSATKVGNTPLGAFLNRDKIYLTQDVYASWEKHPSEHHNLTRGTAAAASSAVATENIFDVFDVFRRFPGF